MASLPRITRIPTTLRPRLLVWVAGASLIFLTPAGTSCTANSGKPASAQIAAAVERRAEHMRLSELGGLPPWTALHVFGPYTSAKSMEDRLGFAWSGAGRYRLHERDDILLAVFCSGTRVVRVEEWPRGRFAVDAGMLGRPLRPETWFRLERTGPTTVLLHEESAEPFSTVPIRR